MSFFGFHPLIEEWFRSRFEGPTEPQREGWPHIAAGEHTLIAAPTGSGKTLTAFLACIDRLFQQAVKFRLPNETRVIYISPLRALSNDMHRNLELPLQEIRALAESRDVPIPKIRVGLRTGDTSSSERSALVRKPPHILVTTPESLYLMLTSPKARETLLHVETVIIDEIHSLIRDKRGCHLSLTLERLEAARGQRIQRIGLSATQKPISRVARFLTGQPRGGERLAESLPAGNGLSDSTAHPDGLRRGGEGERGRGGEKSLQNQTGLFDLPLAEKTGSLRTPLASESRDSVLPLSLSPPLPLFDGRGNDDEKGEDVAIVNVGHRRELDLAVEIPEEEELGAICSHEQWDEVFQRLVQRINEHRSTLIFVNTRRMAERVTHQLTELMGEECIGSHHGSLSTETRHRTEQGLKNGTLKAVVATASLELGLDIGYIDLVIQIGSPRSIATFLQRIGRSGHSLGLVPKGRVFAMTRDELVEAMALIRAVRAGELDTLIVPQAPLDVLAQQLVAEVATRDWQTDELFELCRRSDSYRDLNRKDFDRTVQFLSEGVTDQAGRSRVYLHHDHVNKKVRARQGARLTALSNGGAIPEIASYRVVAEPEGTVVGTLDEHFAVETSKGDVFLLGNNSWQILYVRGGDVRVVDAHGAPPTIPFWEGEAPGRTLELSSEISRLRADLETQLHDLPAAEKWLMEECSCTHTAAAQIVTYAAAQHAAIGLLPTQKRVVFERFFDESGGMQLVVHAPFGSAITKAWGFAMRKRFCRSFDFELQATADDDGFILSLGPQHSFPIETLFPMLTKDNARNLLEQAMFQVPLFQVRWRWNVTRALLVNRMNNGRKVPPALQRFKADDLLTAVFPKLTGCQEEHTGDHILPDHPLTQQTMHDCLHEALNLPGLLTVLEQIEKGEIELIARDTREPSPFCYELLNAAPYAFLDGGEAQERRARAVPIRRSLDVESVRDLGHLDPAAIEQVIQEAQPFIRNADELHDALMSRVILPVRECSDWQRYYDQLAADNRVTTLTLPDGNHAWACAERLQAARAAFPDAPCNPALTTPPSVQRDWTNLEARLAMVRGLIETCGPITHTALADRLCLTPAQAFATLEALEGEGVVLRGKFTPQSRQPEETGSLRTPLASDNNCHPLTLSPPHLVSDESGADAETEWCHRRLLARIHRLTLDGLRRQIEPVTVEVFQRFLFRHHGLVPSLQRTGTNGLFEVVSQLQGLDIPAVSWEEHLLPLRLSGYSPGWLDELCLHGEVGWGRLYPPPKNPDKSKPMASLTRVAPISLWLRGDGDWLTANRVDSDPETLSGEARDVLETLRTQGATFSLDLMQNSRMLPSQLYDVLGELVTRGFVTADGFSGLRQLLDSKNAAARAARRHRGLTRERSGTAAAGRWSVWKNPVPAESAPSPAEVTEQWAWQLLRRWGVMFRDLLIRESGAPSWYELLQVYRKLEARGEIRGGRFISGVAGEQFALGDTIGQLRKLRDEAQTRKQPQELVTLCAADPLNLVGILTNHPRVPSTAGNRVAWLDGQPAASLQGGHYAPLLDLPEKLATLVRKQIDHPGILPLDGEESSGSDDNFIEKLRKKKKQNKRPDDTLPSSGMPNRFLP